MSSDPAPEWSRPVRLRPPPRGDIALTASPAECAALARRLGLDGIDSLAATLSIAPAGEAFDVTGTLTCALRQICAVAGTPFPATVNTPVFLRLVPEEAAGSADLSAALAVTAPVDDADEFTFAGDSADLGEAMAQTLALHLDPYPHGPDAQTVRETFGIGGDDQPAGALAEALARLRPN
ncbi:DUF177 domain-containing protein [Erythrobacteraceae bacterium CFH 75059]|uniref:YceD family protein n=1 Tax=Qipengyuania thermophila TaxID=2509361 RepID=UPI001020CF86|nr:DUF177 domain-containing protein [Qipengyuania thermophila]TCD04084.1 DUF177 domain-containing protein [Erythrobacteraceae bacterium CFH 75059]